MGIRLAIIGATGAVGAAFLEVLEERTGRAGALEIDSLRLLASGRSAGKRLSFRGEKIAVEDLAKADLAGIDIALFSAGGAISRSWAPRFVAAGAVVVDNSSAFRMDPEVPLVVPEINAAAASDRPKGVIANPNCSTIILLVPLFPLHREARVLSARVATYQAVSGAGARALEELESQTRDLLEGRAVSPQILPHRIGFNLFSHNSAVGADGYNEEETKMRKESAKILSDESIRISATCVRVPVHRAHCEAISIETERALSPERAREILAAAPGVKVVDDPAKNHFPMPYEASGQDLVLVGRIRRDTAAAPGAHGLSLFVSGDQLRKGAATNAVQIAEFVARERRATTTAGAGAR